MGWGGSVHAMIASLKYNNSQLRKKRIFPELKRRFKEETDNRIYANLESSNLKHLNDVEVRKIVSQIKQEMRARGKRNKLISITVLILIIILALVFLRLLFI